MSTARGRERARTQAASLMSTARRLPSASSPTRDASQAPLSQVPIVPFPSSFASQVPILSRPAHHTRAHHTNSHLSQNPRFVMRSGMRGLADLRDALLKKAPHDASEAALSRRRSVTSLLQSQAPLSQVLAMCPSLLPGLSQPAHFHTNPPFSILIHHFSY